MFLFSFCQKFLKLQFCALGLWVISRNKFCQVCSSSTRIFCRVPNLRWWTRWKKKKHQLILKWKFILVHNESFRSFDFQLRSFSLIIQVVKEYNCKHGIRKKLANCIISRVMPKNNILAIWGIIAQCLFAALVKRQIRIRLNFTHHKSEANYVLFVTINWEIQTNMLK